MDNHALYVDKANGFFHDSDNPNLKRFSGWQFWSPGGDLNNDTFVKKQLIIELTKSYSDGLNNVTIPALIMWGRHDGILPVELAQDAYEALGTDSQQKHIFIFENSAHSPNREEPDLFIKEFKKFIEQYR
jgi:proline iminopeptidase